MTSILIGKITLFSYPKERKPNIEKDEGEGHIISISETFDEFE